ncbi:efflux RND transporter periplasmic adaptor subunit, partial [Vibrio fortis]
IGQSDLGSAKLGQEVSIEVDSFAGETFKGVVDYIAPAVDESSGRVEIHAHIKNPEHRLVPGMFAKLSQVTSDEEPELVVSQNAVLAKDNTRFVWVVNGETIEQRVVELGVNTNDGHVVIEDGLKQGEKIVVTGQQNLKKSSLVKVMNQGSQETQESVDLPHEPTTAEQSEKKQEADVHQS